MSQNKHPESDKQRPFYQLFPGPEHHSNLDSSILQNFTNLVKALTPENKYGSRARTMYGAQAGSVAQDTGGTLSVYKPDPAQQLGQVCTQEIPRQRIVGVNPVGQAPVMGVNPGGPVMGVHPKYQDPIVGVNPESQAPVMGANPRCQAPIMRNNSACQALIMGVNPGSQTPIMGVNPGGQVPVIGVNHGGQVPVMGVNPGHQLPVMTGNLRDQGLSSQSAVPLSRIHTVSETCHRVYQTVDSRDITLADPGLASFIERQIQQHLTQQNLQQHGKFFFSVFSFSLFFY